MMESVDVTLGNLPPPFTLDSDLKPTDVVKEFSGVIGQIGELINAGDYVELRDAHNEVGVSIR